MPQSTSNPVFILVRPQMGENIGAAARAMWNFGQDRLRVVDPRDGWPNERAVALASGAGRLLDAAGLHLDFPGAIADCDVVYATTARPRGLTKRIVTPERAAQEIAALQAQGKRAGLVFGPERAGLENAEISRASAIINVPVNPDFPSLNLAQCVLLMAYELSRNTAPLPERMELAGTDFASALEIEKLGDHYEAQLDEAGFFFPADKAPGMKLTLRNLWARLALTRADVQVLHGVLRQMVRWARRQPRRDGTVPETSPADPAHAETDGRDLDR